MADDIVPLGFDVDTSGLNSAKKEAASAASEISKLGDVVDKLAKAASNLNSAAMKPLEQTTKAVTTDAKALSDALKPLDENTKKAATDLAQLVEIQKKAAATGDAHLQATSGLAKQIEALAGKLNSSAAAHDRMNTAASRTGKNAQEATDKLTGFASVLDKLKNAGGTAESSVGKIGQNFAQVGEVLGGGGHGGGGVTAALGLAQRAFQGLTGFVTGSAVGAMTGIAAGVAVVSAAYMKLQGVLAESQDEYRLLSGQIRIAVHDADLAAEATQRVIDSANRAGISVEAYADTFTRFERIRKEMGLTTEGVLDFTEAITKLGKISGSSPQQIQMGLMQLSQGLGSGKLQGQDLKFMMEDMPALGEYIAKGMGVSIGRLKDMGSNGELTPEKVVGALKKSYEDIDKEAAHLPETVAQATQRMKNDFGGLKAALGEVLMSTQVVQAGLNAMDGGMQWAKNRLTDNYTLAQLEKLKADLQKDQVDFRMQGMNTSGLDARMKEVQALIDKQQKAAAASKKEAAEQPEHDADNLKTRIAESDTYAKKQKELKQNIADVTAQIEKLNNGIGYSTDKDKADKLDYFTRALGRMNEEMRKSGTAAQQMAQSLDNATSDRNIYGIGSSGIAQSTRKLSEDAASKGQPIIPGDYDALFAKGELSTNIDKNALASISAKAELSKMGGVGASGSTRAKLDAAASAEQYRAQTFGTGLQAYTPEANDAVKQYQESLEKVALAQNAVNEATARFGASSSLRVAQAGLAVAGDGPYAVQLAQQRAQRSQRNAQSPGVGDLEFSSWQAQQDLAVKQQLAEAQRTTQQLRDEIGSAGSPNSLAAIRAQAEADKIRRSTAPGAAQDGLIADAMQQPQLKQDQQLADQTEQMKRQLDLAREQAAIYRKGGADMDEQLAIVQKRYELEQAGLTPSNQYYQTQLQLTAELAKQTREMNQQKTFAGDFQKAFGDVARTIGTDLTRTFDTLFTTTGSKMKALLNGISGLVQNVSNTIIQDMIVKPFEQIATQYGSSLLQKFLNGLGGGTGSTSTLGLGSGIDSSVASSTSSLYTPSVSAYNFTMNAKGGAYDSPSLSSYSGQVLTKPTFFAFASGAGVAGEAGPEGILPLARGANGSLGVKAYGGSSGGDSAPAITIIDQRTAKDSQPVQTSSGSDASGKKFIQVLVRDTVKGGMAAGEYDATMKANFQATRPLTKR
jgi:tape measure domain-containing protein